ncbi:hypothetical protein MTsPCn5_24610 [Croceitalea sp. MTPC5]|nr:hypothetical protein MTsPCn5_24610 [Croceitalea sp. MTPC5]
MLLCYFITEGGTAQKKEKSGFATFHYDMVPEVGEASWNQYSVAFNKSLFSFKRQELGFVAGYRNTTYDFFETAIPSVTKAFEEIHLITGGFFYRHDLQRNWGFEVTFSPVISSTLDSGISGADFQYGGNANIHKIWNTNDGKVTALKLGAGYGTALGQPSFYPVFSFMTTFNRWSLELGFPGSSITYDITPRHDLCLNAEYLGSYANIQNGLPIGQEVYNDSKLEYEAIDLGVTHKYRLQPNFTSVLRMGYLMDNNLRLLSGNEQQLNEFNTSESIYFSMGLILNFNN